MPPVAEKASILEEHHWALSEGCTQFFFAASDIVGLLYVALPYQSQLESFQILYPWAPCLAQHAVLHSMEVEGNQAAQAEEMEVRQSLYAEDCLIHKDQQGLCTSTGG